MKWPNPFYFTAIVEASAGFFEKLQTHLEVRVVDCDPAWLEPAPKNMAVRKVEPTAVEKLIKSLESNPASDGELWLVVATCSKGKMITPLKWIGKICQIFVISLTSCPHAETFQKGLSAKGNNRNKMHALSKLTPLYVIGGNHRLEAYRRLQQKSEHIWNSKKTTLAEKKNLNMWDSVLVQVYWWPDQSEEHCKEIRALALRNNINGETRLQMTFWDKVSLLLPISLLPMSMCRFILE
ncbi:MAG: hypothetical protein ACYCQJ_16310 [Nitrososphaerales archaeon]